MGELDMVLCCECIYRFATRDSDELDDCRRYPTPIQTKDTYCCGEGELTDGARAERMKGAR